MRARLLPAMLCAAFVLFAAPAPARAADEATLSCVVETADADTRAAVERNVRDMFDAERDAKSQATLTGLDAAARSCAKRHGWSDDARRAAIAYGMAVLGLPIAADEMRKRGLDPDRLTALYNQLPQELREKVPSGSAPPEFVAMVEQGSRDGLIPADGDAQHAVSQLFALLFIRDVGRAAFLRG